MFKSLLLAFLCFVMVGCQSSGYKETGGTLLGAAIGGLVGNQIGGGTGQVITTTAGVFVGGMLGRELGAQLDRADAERASRAFNLSMNTPPNITTTWRNPTNNVYGTITPLHTYNDGGRYCREYQQTITIGGKQKTAYGTACLQRDGQWQIMD